MSKSNTSLELSSLRFLSSTMQANLDYVPYFISLFSVYQVNRWKIKNPTIVSRLVLSSMAFACSFPPSIFYIMIPFAAIRLQID